MPRFKVRTPQQDRSRESFERILDAALELLEERGHQKFTLHEVSRRSRVSIGSIYCRVDSKNALLHAVQDRFTKRINLEHSALVNAAREKGRTLAEIVPLLVRGMSDLLFRNAAILRAFMSLSKIDPRVEREGKKSYGDLASKVTTLLLEYGSEICHPDPKHAVDFCFNVTYVVLGGFLGFGTDIGTAKTNWNDLAEDLGIMCSSFLLSDWKRLPGDRDRFRIESAITWDLFRQEVAPD